MVDEKLRKEFKKKLIDDNLTAVEFARKLNISKTYLYVVISGRAENLRIECIIREYARTDSR